MTEEKDRASEFSPRPEFEKYSLGDNSGRLALADGVIENLRSMYPKHDSIRSVCDIGAGAGTMLLMLIQQRVGERFVAVDVHEKMPEVVRSLVHDPRLETYVLDTENLPFGDSEFDLAVLSHVVEHVEKPIPIIIESSRIGRHLYIEVPLEGTIGMKLSRWIRRVLLRSETFSPGDHVHFFSPNSFRRLLEDSGVEIAGFRVYYPEKLLSNNDRLSIARNRFRGTAKSVIRQGLVRVIGPSRWAHLYNGFAGALVTSPSKVGEPTERQDD